MDENKIVEMKLELSAASGSRMEGAVGGRIIAEPKRIDRVTVQPLPILWFAVFDFPRSLVIVRSRLWGGEEPQAARALCGEVANWGPEEPLLLGMILITVCNQMGIIPSNILLRMTVEAYSQASPATSSIFVQANTYLPRQIGEWRDLTDRNRIAPQNL